MSVGRDDLEVGGTCFLRIGYDGASSQVKLRRAQVVEVVRAAARLRLLDTGRELTARFNMLEPDHDYLQERAERERKRKERLREDSLLPPPAPLKLLPQPQPVKEKPARSDLESWLEMGRDVLTPIDEELSLLRTSKESLEAERIAIDDELGRIAKSLVELDRKKAVLVRVLKDLNGSG